jgi:hypothetical protein
MERSLYKVGDKQVCGSCFSDLKRCGFVNMFDGSHLYKDGHVEKKQATSDVLDGDNDEQI